MTPIKNRKDLEFAYSFRRYLQHHDFSDTPLLPGQPDARPELIRELSEAIHAYHRKQAERELANSDRRIVHDDNIDGYCLRIDMLDDFGSIDEARAWFEEYEVIHYRPSYYDCTGQMFTSWYRIFRHPDGHYIAYHYIACDC